MKQYIFPIFIITIGLFTAYAFYAFWHSEEVNPPKSTKTSQKNLVDNISSKDIIVEDAVVVPEPSLETHSQVTDEKMMQEIEKEADIPNLNPKQMQEKTQAIYDELTPENYEETMEEAVIAFDTLDSLVEEVDTKLGEEMQSSEEEISVDMEEGNSKEEQIDEVSSVLENEEEIDMEDENVNNL